MMDIEKFIFESFAFSRVDNKETNKKNHEFCEKMDAFINCLDENQREQFSEIEKLINDLQYEEERELLRFVLGILRGLFNS